MESQNPSFLQEDLKLDPPPQKIVKSTYVESKTSEFRLLHTK